MPRQVHLFDPPVRFVVGTVGQPGDRTFYLQASGQGRVVSVALEKLQVSVLAERLTEMLEEVQRRLDLPLPPPADQVEDTGPLQSPVDEEFRVGSMGLAFDADSHVVVVEAHAQTEEEIETPEPMAEVEDGADVLRVLLSPEAARAFITRAERVVSAGRPACPLCDLPLDPTGHICPRQNGYRR